MSTLDINIPHQLSQQEALSRIKQLLEKVKRENGDKVKDLKEEWNGDKGSFQFNAQGFDLAGTIEVKGNNVNINSKLPFALSFFKGRIESMITEKATELLR